MSLPTNIVTAALLLVAAAPEAAQDAAKPLSAALTGAAEVPRPGDADGSGTAKITISPADAEVCYEITVAKIDAATMAHIHKGAPGEAGKPVVTLDPPANGSTDGCAPMKRELGEAILKAPGDYYVNVHNAAHPAGAVRGQLAQ